MFQIMVQTERKSTPSSGCVLVAVIDVRAARQLLLQFVHVLNVVAVVQRRLGGQLVRQTGDLRERVRVLRVRLALELNMVAAVMAVR